ncbi:MAG: prepilin-type N-terminal cleavage/methylation domain-containing protein [Thermodesulfovibrionales bacterium]|nr:prepilin-type N-terminal cleavage/methylation domain-containing protein [Thermodesulfovibrionales bacterium]
MKKEAGFTLLELIISITLMALIVTISLGGFRIANSSVSKAEKKTEELERFRTAISLIDRQIQSLIYVLKRQELEQVNYIVGDTSSFTFVSNISLWDRDLGYVLVTYEVERDINNRYNLKTTERLISTNTEEYSTHLLKGLQDIRFEYLFTENITTEMIWHNEFKRKNGTPYAVRLTLKSDIWQGTLNIPIRNFVQSTGIQ